jgi:hypothetical protein
VLPIRRSSPAVRSRDDAVADRGDEHDRQWHAADRDLAHGDLHAALGRGGRDPVERLLVERPPGEVALVGDAEDDRAARAHRHRRDRVAQVVRGALELQRLVLEPADEPPERSRPQRGAVGGQVIVGLPHVA